MKKKKRVPTENRSRLIDQFVETFFERIDPPFGIEFGRGGEEPKEIPPFKFPDEDPDLFTTVENC
jgi:hypothetical protein